MFYKKQRHIITSNIYEKLRNNEHDNLKIIKLRSHRKSRKIENFKNHHGYSGNYILSDIIKAAQCFYDHNGKSSWYNDSRLNLEPEEYITMIDNMTRSGADLSPLLVYFHSKVSENGVPSKETFNETVQKYGRIVHGYLDYQSRPHQLQDIDDFVL